MTIRSRHASLADASAALPAFLSVNVWLGLRSWLLSVACSLGIFGLLASFAWHGTNGRVIDLMTLLVALPAAGASILLIIATLWVILARVPFASGLMFGARVLPLAWMAPIAELIATGGHGAVISTVSFGGPSYLVACLTGLLLPLGSGVPLGLRVSIFIAALAVAFVTWFARTHASASGSHRLQDVLCAVGTFIAASVTLVKFTLVPTGLAMFGGLLRGGGWIFNADDALREAVRAVTNGYWWSSIYERFPSAIEQQADIAIRLTSIGFVALTLGIILIILFIWRVPRWRSLVMHAFGAWSAFDLAFIVIGATVITSFSAQLPSATTVFWWVAPMLGMFALIAFRLHAVLERCLHHDTDGATDPTNPLACGDIVPSVAQDLSLASLLYILIATLALGWPIFATVLASLAASYLSRDRMWTSWTWSATAFRAFGAAALALAGFFFASQQARLSTSAILVMVLAAGYQIGRGVFKKKIAL